MLFAGYVKDPEKTAESMLPGGWWKTGDLAVLQDNDTFKMTGRSKDMIIRGGENIQPTEIENYYNEIEGIEDIYVIGVPSKRLGEEVAAYIKVNYKTI
jgi:acyl-CoA synthetase (AMP-forming)/AMP-acid ligase II